MRCGTIRLCIIISRIYLLSGGSLMGMVLLRKWSVILIFYCLAFYFFILLCCVCLLACTLFLSFFVTIVFERTSGGDSPQLCRFIFVLALEIHRLCSILKRRGDYMKTSYPRCFGVEYTWSVCRDLAGGYFSINTI